MITCVCLPSADGEERWNVTEGIYQRFVSGQLVEESPFSPDDEDGQIVINALEVFDGADLLLNLRTALATNQTYLDKVVAETVTAADETAQVAALTEQMVTVMLRSMLQIR